jgi:hypothetical protein
LAETNLLEGETEKQLSDETVQLDSVAEWSSSATGGEGIKGDQVDLPFDFYEGGEMQQRSLHGRRIL